MSWSIAGKRVEFRAGLPAGKLVVTDKPRGTPEYELKLATKGEWQLPVGAHQVKVVRTSQFVGPKIELFGASGALIPPSEQHLVPGAAPSGSECPSHRVAATYACARCGTFVCSRCEGVDFTHCQTCLAALTQVATKNSAAAVYFAPVVIFAVFGGLIGGLFAGLAGAAAVAIAKRVENKAIKVAAAIVLYGIAAAVWLVIAASLRS